MERMRRSAPIQSSQLLIIPPARVHSLSYLIMSSLLKSLTMCIQLAGQVAHMLASGALLVARRQAKSREHARRATLRHSKHSATRQQHVQIGNPESEIGSIALPLSVDDGLAAGKSARTEKNRLSNIPNKVDLRAVFRRP